METYREMPLDKRVVDKINQMQYSMVLYLQNPCQKYLKDIRTHRQQLIFSLNPHSSSFNAKGEGFFGWYRSNFFKHTHNAEFNKLITDIFNGFDSMLKYIDKISNYNQVQITPPQNGSKF